MVARVVAIRHERVAHHGTEHVELELAGRNNLKQSNK